ncbi:hypothetical protein D3C81_2224050 [compost metagenome]
MRFEKLAPQLHGIDADMNQQLHAVRSAEHHGMLRLKDIHDGAADWRYEFADCRYEGNPFTHQLIAEGRVIHLI